MKSVGWLWPLQKSRPEVPRGDEPGRFGAVRKFDTHTGVDLYCEPGEAVLAVASGEVVAVENFTGPEAGSPWWNATKAVLVEGFDGVVVYGEIEPVVSVGATIERGAVVGHVKTVLKRDKGRPMTMLHFELYAHGVRETVWWPLDVEQPSNLRNPALALRIARGDHLKGP